MSKRKIRGLLTESQYALTAGAFFAAALAAAFMGRDNYVMTGMCQIALFFMVMSGICGVAKTNI